jgi:hypothetical protein
MARIVFLMLAAVTPASSRVPDLKLSPPLVEQTDRPVGPPRLFIQTLRVPFGEDWGGEMFAYIPISRRLSVGLFMQAWNEAICSEPACPQRAIEGGVELRYRMKPGLDLGGSIGVQRSGDARGTPAVLPRIHLKF